MRTTRTLRLDRERLTRLDSGDLADVVGAGPEPVSGRLCVTREEGGCQWTYTWSPWICLTLGPCH